MRRRPFRSGFRGFRTRGVVSRARLWKATNGVWGLQGEEEAPVPGLRGRRGAVDSFYFYDLETTGRNPRWHRIVQCAGVRTDAKLEPLADPEAWTVAVGDDVVPEPEAVPVSSPQRVAAGLEERAFSENF